jgi:hypothetical protein
MDVVCYHDNIKNTSLEAVCQICMQPLPTLSYVLPHLLNLENTIQVFKWPQRPLFLSRWMCLSVSAPKPACLGMSVCLIRRVTA